MKPRKIKVPLSTANKRRFSKWVLDIVENWPIFQGGIINQLQIDRQFQRKDTDDTFEQTKPPDGVSFTILGFRLFEVFFLEDFGSFEKGILDLCNGSTDYFNVERIRKELPRIKQSIWFGGFYNLGFICRPKEFFGGNVIRRMGLPDGVDFIHLSFQKNLPSMITVCSDVFLKPEVNQKLQRVQREKCLPEFSIEAICFPPLYATTYILPAVHVQRNAVLNEIEGFRFCVEELILPFIQGYFSKTAITKSKLPAIEIYSLKAENNLYENFEHFANENRFWFYSIGFQFFFRAFKNKFMIFHEEDYAFERPTKNSINCAPYKVILFEEPAIEWLEMGEDKDPRRILLYFDRYLDKLTLPLVLLSIQNEEQEKVEKIRGKTSISFTNKRCSRRLKPIFDELDQVQSVLRSVERINFDFEQAKKWTTRELIKEDGRELVGFLPNNQTKEPRKFSDYLLSIIESNNKILYEHSAFLEKYFSRHVELINIEAIYNLQVVTVALTIGAFVLGIISVIAGWQSILQFLSMVPHFIGQVLDF